MDFQRLYLSAPCGLLTMSFEGLITEVNDTLLEWLGRDRVSLVGTAFTSLLDPGSQLFYETRHMPVLRLQGGVREVSLTLTRSDGSPLPILLNAEMQDVDGAAVIHTAVFDATSRQEYERDLLAARRSAEASEARVLVLQTASTGFAQSRTDEDVAQALLAAATEAFAATATGVFLRTDAGFALLAGVHPLDGLIPPDAPLASNIALDEGRPLTVSADDDSGNFPFVVAGLKAKHLEAVTIIPLLRNGQPLGVLACFFARRREFDPPYIALQAALARQASQAFVRVRLQNELERLALHDQLTGLANRQLLQDTVTQAIDNALASGSPLSVIFLDLDGFKAINDQLGHVFGDTVLLEVANRIRSAVRHEDTVGRYGGDEFVVVCEDADEDAASSIADRVRALVADPVAGIPEAFRVTASVGIATYVPDGSSRPSNDEMLTLADSAMYLAKAAGKNRLARLRR